MRTTRYTLLALMLAFMLPSCSQDPANSLVGSWTSDASKSLESMRSIAGIPDETKAYFEKDFFGRLTMVYKEDTYSAYLQGEQDIKQDSFPYKIVEETPDYYVVEVALLGTKFNKKLFKAGACYYELTSEWNFREYFCKAAVK